MEHNATVGGVFHLENKAQLYMYLCDIQKNRAFREGGVFYVNSESAIVINGTDV